jgi:rhomboid protease GluP
MTPRDDEPPPPSTVLKPESTQEGTPANAGMAGDPIPSSTQEVPVVPTPPARTPDPVAEFRRTLVALTPRVYVTPFLVATNVLVFVLMVASGVYAAKSTLEEMVAWGANFGPLTLAGDWWRLVSCTFLHFGILHLAFNMWVLLDVGPLVERMVGNIGFLLLYLVSGLCGSLASLLWHPAAVGAGASGAIFGVCGALLGLLVLHRGSVPAESLARLWKSGLAFLGYNLLYGLMDRNIDAGAHLGGLVAGFFCGCLQSRAFTPGMRVDVAARNFGVAALGLVLGLGGFAALHARYRDIAAPGESKVHYGDLDVSYKDGATREQADRLGAYLEKCWGTRSGPATVQLTKSDDGYHLRIVVKKEFQHDPDALQRLQFEGARVSRDVLDAAPVVVDACDERLNTLQSLPPRELLRYGVAAGRVEVFFSADTERERAKRLAEYLVDAIGTLTDWATFALVHRGEVAEVHIVTRAEFVKDAAFLADLRRLRNGAAIEVFDGAPVTFYLCDVNLKVIQPLAP